MGPIRQMFLKAGSSRDEKSINVSELEKPKFENVIGSNNNADAKIAGITPAVFIFNGR